MLPLVLAPCMAGVHAQEELDHVLRALPDLPTVQAEAPGYFDLAGESAEMGYATRVEKWSAKLDQYLDLSPSLTVDYGLLLTNRLSAGGTFRRENTFSEVILNGVYAPQRNVRLRLTGAQLRNTGGLMPSASGDNAILQNSVLLNARKSWDKYLFLSDLGLTAYSTQANAPATVAEDDGGPARGRKDGYMLNLGMHPTAHSRVELRREFGHLSYSLGENARYAADLASSRMKYSHYLGNCMRVQGRYSTGSDAERLDLNLARNKWSINLSREQGMDNNSAIMIGYTMPLGTHGMHDDTCPGRPSGAPAFEPIIDASMARPTQLPSTPLPMEMRY